MTQDLRAVQIISYWKSGM